MMSLMVAVARRLLLVRMLRAETILLVPVLGMDNTDIKSAWLANLFRLVLLRLTMVDVSGFRYEPTSDAVTPETVLVSSVTVCRASEPDTSEAAWDLVAKESTETMVDRRLPVLGNPRCMASGRGRSAMFSMSSADASTEEEKVDEAASTSLCGSSTEVVSRSGEDMERLFVGECWLRFAPRRLSVGVGVSDSSLSLSCAEEAAVSSETTVEGASSTICVSMCISRLRRRRRRLLPLPLLRLWGTSTGSSCVSVEVVTSDLSSLAGSSSVDTESLDFLLRRDSPSTKGSGVLLSQASRRLPKALVGGVSDAAGSTVGVAVSSSSVLGSDRRLRLRFVVGGTSLGDCSAARSPWLRGRRLRRRSRISSSRGDVMRLSSYSTVMMLAGSSLRDVSDLRAGLFAVVYGASSSADSDARGEVCARRLRRTFTTSDASFPGGGEAGSGAFSSLFPWLPLPDPLLTGRCSFSELAGLEGRRCFGAGFFWPVLLPT